MIPGGAPGERCPGGPGSAWVPAPRRPRPWPPRPWPPRRPPGRARMPRPAPPSRARAASPAAAGAYGSRARLTLRAMPVGRVAFRRDRHHHLMVRAALFGLTPGSSHAVDLRVPGRSRVIRFSPLTANSGGQAYSTLSSNFTGRWRPGSRLLIRMGVGGGRVAREPIAETRRLLRRGPPATPAHLGRGHPQGGQLRHAAGRGHPGLQRQPPHAHRHRSRPRGRSRAATRPTSTWAAA